MCSRESFCQIFCVELETEDKCLHCNVMCKNLCFCVCVWGLLIVANASSQICYITCFNEGIHVFGFFYFSRLKTLWHLCLTSSCHDNAELSGGVMLLLSRR